MSKTVTLSKTNLDKFNHQDNVTMPKITRRPSVVSRRSSISSNRSVDRWRRWSRAFSTSLGGHPRGTSRTTETPQSKTVVKYENTYKMVPDEGTRFSPGPIEKIMTQLLINNLEGARYEPKTCSIFAQRISEEIKQRVKDMRYPRYKLVAQVHIGSNNGQSVNMASRAVWNTETDNYATACYQNKTMYAVATVHAVYFE